MSEGRGLDSVLTVERISSPDFLMRLGDRQRRSSRPCTHLQCSLAAETYRICPVPHMQLHAAQEGLNFRCTADWDMTAAQRSISPQEGTRSAHSQMQPPTLSQDQPCHAQFRKEGPFLERREQACWHQLQFMTSSFGQLPGPSFTPAGDTSTCYYIAAGHVP